MPHAHWRTTLRSVIGVMWVLWMLCLTPLALGQITRSTLPADLFGIPTTAQGAIYPITARTGPGSTCTAATLNAALSALGTAQATVVLPPRDGSQVLCTWTLEANVTVPATVYLTVAAPVAVNAGMTLTLHGPHETLIGPNWYSGAGTVTFARNIPLGSAESYRSQWRNVVVAGGWHGPSGSTTLPAFSTRAWIDGRDVFQEALAVSLTAGDGTYFLGLRMHPAVTPAGWTCSSAYCWVQSATPPATPPGTLILGRTTVTANAASALTILAPWRLLQPYPVPAAQTLTFAACPDAGPWHIFEADGMTTGRVVIQAPHCTAYAEWWGADNTGGTTGQQAYFTLASDALATGGTLMGGGAQAHYRFNDQWRVHASNFTFDGQGALLSGAPAVEGETLPVIFVTDGGGQEVSGETAQFLHNVTLRNYRVGVVGTYPQDQMRGGVLQGCVNCTIENVRVKTSRGTTFTLFRCESCTLRNIYIEHGSTTSANFATLLVHSNNTLVDTWYARGLTDGTGPCCFMFQVKGGINNRIVNATLEDVTNPVVVGAKHAFFSRGDDPWSESPTDPVNNPYPFPTNPNAPAGQQDCKLNNCYLYPDRRRASADTRWTNITVRNAPGANCMTVQEAYGDHIIGFTGSQCRIGIQFNQSPQTGAGERDFLLNTFHLRDLGLTATDGDGIYAVNVNGAGTDSADGPDVAAAAFRNIRISNGVIESSAGPGVAIEAASAVVVTNVVTHNVALLAETEKEGFRVAGNARNVKLIGNTARDSQPTPTINYGFRIQEEVRAPTLVDNTVDCTHCPFGTFHYYRAVPVGRYDNNSPAFCTARTTDATPEFQRCVLLTKDGDRFRIISACAARQGTTNRAYYERTAVVEDNAGVITIYPNTGTGDTTFESQSAWDVSYAAVLEELRIRPQGAAEQTVDWWCDVRVIDMRE